jgi:tetratricopeptide (TPR) repeat protein
MTPEKINDSDDKNRKPRLERKEFKSFFIPNREGGGGGGDKLKEGLLSHGKMIDIREKKNKYSRFSTSDASLKIPIESSARDPSQIAFQKFRKTFFKKNIKERNSLSSSLENTQSKQSSSFQRDKSRESTLNWVQEFDSLPHVPEDTIDQRNINRKKINESTKKISPFSPMNLPSIRSITFANEDNEVDDKSDEELEKSGASQRSYMQKRKKKMDIQELELIELEALIASKENRERLERILVILFKLTNHYKGVIVSKLGIDLDGSLGEILTLISQLHLPKFQLKTLECYGKIMLLVGNYRRAMRIFKNHRNLSLLINNDKEKIVSYNFIALTYSITNEYDKALIYLKKMLKHAWKINDVNAELKTYDQIGMVYYKMGHLEKSTFFHEKMIRGESEEKEAWFRKLAEESVDIKRRMRLQKYMHQIIFEEFTYTQLTKDSQAVQSLLTDSEDDFDLEVFMRENIYRAERALKDMKTPRSSRSTFMKFHIQKRMGKPGFDPKSLGPITKSLEFFKSTVLQDSYGNHQKASWMLNHLSGNRSIESYLVNTYKNPLFTEFSENINQEFDDKDRKKLISYLLTLKKIVEKYVEEISKSLGIAVPLTIILNRKRGRYFSNANRFGLINLRLAKAGVN